jgi:hypothetical protein
MLRDTQSHGTTATTATTTASASTAATAANVARITHPIIAPSGSCAPACTHRRLLPAAFLHPRLLALSIHILPILAAIRHPLLLLTIHQFKHMHRLLLSQIR